MLTTANVGNIMQRLRGKTTTKQTSPSNSVHTNSDSGMTDSTASRRASSASLRSDSDVLIDCESVATTPGEALDRQQSEVKVLPPMPAASPSNSDVEATIPMKREPSNFPMIVHRRASSAEHVANLAKQQEDDSDVEMFSRTMDTEDRMKFTSKRMRTALDKWVSTGKPQQHSQESDEEMPLGTDGAREALKLALQRSANKLNLCIKMTVHEDSKDVGKKSTDKPEERPRKCKSVEKLATVDIVPETPVQKEPEAPAGCRPFKAGVDDSGPRPFISDTESTRSSSSSSRPRFPRGPQFDTTDAGIKRHSYFLQPPLKITQFLGAEYPINKHGSGRREKTMLNTYTARAGDECAWPLPGADPLVAVKSDVPPEHLMQNIANMLVWSSDEENHSWYRQKMQKDDRYCPFYSQSVPGITPAMYLQRLRLHFGSTAGCFIAACIYIDRLGAKCVNEHTIHRLFLTALVLGTKTCECDLYYENKYYGRCGGVIQSEMNMLEQTLIELLGWKLHITDQEFAAYATALYGPLSDRYWRGEY